MLKESLIEIFERDLNKLKDEINSYQNDESLWKVSGEISNSGGNLCLHLVGNLNHYIGSVLGETGYVRDRDSEFTSGNISREAIVSKIEKTLEIVVNTLNKFTEDDLNRDYPLVENNKPRVIGKELLRIITHFNYHLGQINYHRRLLQNGEK